MKYIGTVVANYERKKRTETIIRIEGLSRPQQIAVIWSIPRSPDALVDLEPGVRVIFAAREGTLTQRMQTDEGTGATATILVAMGLFYDVLDATDAPTDVLYEKIEPKDLEFEGTVGEVRPRPDAEAVARGRMWSITVVLARHGQFQPLRVRFPEHLDGAVGGLTTGDRVRFTAEERSLSWMVDIDEMGRRCVVPAVTVTGIETVGDPEVGGR